MFYFVVANACTWILLPRKVNLVLPRKETCVNDEAGLSSTHDKATYRQRNQF